MILYRIILLVVSIMTIKSYKNPKEGNNLEIYQCPYCNVEIFSEYTIYLIKCPYCGEQYPPNHRCSFCHRLVNPEYTSCPMDKEPLRIDFNCPYCNIPIKLGEKTCKKCMQNVLWCFYCGSPNKVTSTMCIICSIRFSP